MFDTSEEMNLGGASNVDLTEAARLMKQSTAGTGVPNQQVPPPMMLMQQAVAMQQFQFQQALLMQQVRRLCHTYQKSLPWCLLIIFLVDAVVSWILFPGLL